MAAPLVEAADVNSALLLSHSAKCAVATLESTCRVNSFVLGQAKRTNSETAFVADEPRPVGRILFTATLTRN